MNVWGEAWCWRRSDRQINPSALLIKAPGFFECGVTGERRSSRFSAGHLACWTSRLLCVLYQESIKISQPPITIHPPPPSFTYMKFPHRPENHRSNRTAMRRVLQAIITLSRNTLKSSRPAAGGRFMKDALVVRGTWRELGQTRQWKLTAQLLGAAPSSCACVCV